MRIRGEAAPPEMLVRALVNLLPGTIDEESRSVEAVIATESLATPFDMRTMQAVDEVLLMSGVEIEEQATLCDSHPQYRTGMITTADVRGSVREMRVEGDKLVGRLFFASDTPSFDMWTKVRDGHVRQLSVGAIPLEQTEIQPGSRGFVLGKEYRARGRRLFITSRWRVGEVSVLPRGADPQAKIRQASASSDATDAGHSQEESSMNELLRAYLESLGMAKGADEASSNKFIGGLTAEQRAEVERVRLASAGGVATATAAPPAAQAAGAYPPANPNGTQAGTDGAALERVRGEAAAAERTRIAELNRLAGDDVPAEVLRAAIDGGLDVPTASRNFLEAVRARRAAVLAGGGQAPAAHSRNHEQDCTLRALQIGLMLRMGMQVVDPQASDTVRQQQARDAEMGDRYRDLSAIDFCREAVRLDGNTVPHRRDELVRAAVSGGNLVSIFTTNVSARLMAAYMEITDTTSDWCVEADVPNFKSNERHALGKTAQPKRLPRGGKAGHATRSASMEGYKIARYAQQFVVDEQDLIDDDLSAIMTMPTEMGIACGRLRPNLVYSIILANAALQADSVALFHTTHANIATGGGSALALSSLKTAIIAMSKQTEDGVTLNLKPRFLIVPQDLKFTAAEILKSAEVRDTTASTKYGVYNSLQDEQIVLRSDNRLGVAGVTDPVTDTAYPGTATNWLLTTSAAEGRTIEVGYRTGTGRRPQVRSFNLTQGQWGIGWDINMDIGAKALGYQSMYWSAGA
jgi:hypothetical protein